MEWLTIGELASRAGVATSALRFYETKRAVKTASSEQVRQPIYTGALGKWRKYEEHLDEWKDELAPIIDELPEVVRDAGTQRS